LAILPSDVQWCSICLERPADGTATVDDPHNGELELPLCIECVRIMTSPGERQALGIE
jgi:hypothetical protein